MHDPFDGCIWVGADEAYASPVILRRFSLLSVKRAVLRVTGLGYFYACINRTPVTDSYFLPVASDYEPRDLTKFLYPLSDTTTNRIYYYDFDVTHLLTKGENLLSVQLGNGWYRQNERVAEGPVSYGNVLKMTYCLHVETETDVIDICCDGSETHTDSDIRYNNLFHGEVIDRTFVPQPEKPVLKVPAPQALLSPALGSEDKHIGSIRPTLVGRVGSRSIFDAGVNISGIVQLTTSAPRGSVIKIRFAENISDGLSLDFDSTGHSYISASGNQQIMEDTFITDGSVCVFKPRFVWHAFRYFEVEGPFDDAEVHIIHSDVPISSDFSSDLEGMTYLYNAFLRTQLNNMHGSFPSDCPHRERLGYTGDGQVCAPAGMMLLDSRTFYEKWIQDILDCQDRNSGHIQHTAPFMGGGGGPGGWGCAVITVPYAFYKQFGDTDILRKCFAPMLRWVDYMTGHLENGLLTHEEEGGWCLGDWCTLETTVIPESYVNTCFYIKSLRILEEIAGILGKTEHIAELLRLRKTAQEAVCRTYLDAGTHSFAGGIQGADAYALWCGIAEDGLAEKLAAKYDALGHFDTGFICTDILLEVLFAYGYGETAVKLLESEDLGSFLYMKRHGATTIWENWNGASSHDHPMFGGCSRHLFTGVLGIQQKKGSAGYSHIVISPAALPFGKTARGSVKTPLGTVSVVLNCGESPRVTVTAPEAVRVEFAVPPDMETDLIRT